VGFFTVLKSSGCNRALSELLWDVALELLFGIYSRNWKCCHLSHSTYFLYSYW